MILIIDNYDSFTFNLKQAFEVLGHRCKVVRNDQITTAQIRALAPEYIVLSPGPGNPDSAGITLAAIRELAPEIPMLGVCLGLQAIAQAMGGRVIRAPQPKHGKVSRVFHSESGLFEGVESGFVAARYHSLMAERRSLPKCLEITAQTEDGIIMALRHREYRLEGVQFHPESIATVQGPRILQNFAGARR
jgi:para-aminobenzoate synthetase component 2